MSHSAPLELRLDFGSTSPGALGREYDEVWKGDDPSQESAGEFYGYLGPVGLSALFVRITLDTNRIGGWNLG